MEPGEPAECAAGGPGVQHRSKGKGESDGWDEESWEGRDEEEKEEEKGGDAQEESIGIAPTDQIE